MYRNEEAYETHLHKKYISKSFFSSAVFAHLSLSLIKLSTETFPWNKTYKTPTSNGITLFITILTMLEAISTYQDGMVDEVLRNIVSDFRKKGTFGGFSGESMQPSMI